MAIITLTNNFHNTSVNVRFDGSDRKLSPSTIKRIQDKLCGQKDCSCGHSSLSTRGAQPVNISEYAENVIYLEHKEKYYY